MDYFIKDQNLTEDNLKDDLFKDSMCLAIHNKVMRKVAVKEMDKIIHKTIMNDDNPSYHAERVERYEFASALLRQAARNLDRDFISEEVAKKMVKVFIGDRFISSRKERLTDVHRQYKEKYGEYPPKFLVLSPGKACNLECDGCYASSGPSATEKLDFETTRRIISEARDILGIRFITISGGEPFIYTSGGKHVTDLFEEFSDMFFLVHTNGTLITKELAQKLADLGNVTPAISLEGYEKETDERRGKGVYAKIMKAMENLREAGVPFGISVMATSSNTDLLLEDKFYNHYFNEQGATYMWQFQMMPLGRAKNKTGLLVSPEQRISLYKKWEKLLAEDHYPVADFWNSATLTGGCMAFGRWNGYFYINWDGNIMPCVFVPYYVDNIKKLYAEGKTLADGLRSAFFKNGRQWQKDYGFGRKYKENVMMPCPFRDHYKDFKNLIITPDAKGENDEAEAALQDARYEELLNNYDEELQNLSLRIFEEKYVLRMVDVSYK